MIIVILFLQTTLLFQVIKGQANILQKAAVTLSETNPYSKHVNDGNKGSCFSFGNNRAKWIVFDLKSIHEIQKVVLWNGDTKHTQTVSIYVGKEFVPCMFHKQITSWKACKTDIKQNSEKSEVECPGGSNGQFVAVVKGDLLSVQNFESLDLCEVEAFGKSIGGSEMKSRPQISNEQLSPVSQDTFPAIKEIRKDVSSITMPQYSNGIDYVNENCEPIIYDKGSKSAFSIVCKTDDGKGRLVMFGKDKFFQSVLKTSGMSKFKANLLKWLSPQNPSPNVIESSNIKSVNELKQTIKQGDIIDMDVWAVTPKDVLQEIKAMLLKGFIAVSVDHTFWVETTKEVRNSYLEILDIFNADFSPNILNYDGDKTLTLSPNDINDDLLGIDQMLQRMAKNHDYFLRNGKKVGEMLATFSPKLVSKSKSRPSLDKIISKYDDLMKWICPCQAGPAIDKNDRLIIESFGNVIKSQLLANSNYKPPCIELFPGDFTSPPSKKSVSVSLEVQTSDTLSPIGYYLEAGGTLGYKTSDISGKWAMSIGCHSDTLDKERPEWFRYPSIHINRIELGDSGSIFSPYGGVIWLYNADANQKISISLTNVVPSPFFNLRDKSAVSQWNIQKSLPGLWAVIAGDNIEICVDSSLIRSYDGKYLSDLMINQWDTLVKMDFTMKSIDWKEKKQEIVVLDIMPSVGEAHSGYPIVAFDYWYEDVFNLNKIQSKGSWGMCHEIGHNMQESDWTFDGVVEVTNNVFCFYNYEKLWKLPYYGSKAVKFFRDYDRTPEIKKFLDNGAKFKEWNDEPFTALLIYAQMVNNFGWGFYNKVFTHYKNTKMDLKNDKEKIAMWITVTSTIAKQNLIPMFDFWGFPIDDKVKQSLSNLPCFFPDDFYKDLSDTRTKYIKSKYSSCSGVSKFNEDFPLQNYKGEMRPNFIKSIR